jgi:hypothetical protein
MSTDTLNSAPRKQLADQIDRLDHILDGLGDAIPAVVGDAVRQAVRDGVQAAIAEILTNRDLLDALRPQTPTEVPMPAPPADFAVVAAPPSSFVQSIVSPISQAFWRLAAWGSGQLFQVGVRKPVVVAAGVAAVGLLTWMAWPLIAPTILTALPFLFLC